MSLFNRPKWASSQIDSVDDSESNLFSHSDRSFRDIVAEQERKKQAKLKKKKVKEERRASAKHKVKDDFVVESSSKRRRLSLEDDDEAEVNPVHLSTEHNAPSNNANNDHIENDLGRIRRSPRTNRRVDRVVYEKPQKHEKSQKLASSTDVIELGDSEGEDQGIANGLSRLEPSRVDNESDDEFAELARKARQRREQKEKNVHSQTPDVEERPQSQSQGPEHLRARGLPTPPPDPTIQLFISSPIPDTTPLIVHRKLSQRIQEIRQAWCGKQGFSKEFTNEVFFIHRMRRVYDVTTCRSLGLETDADGNVVLKGAEGTEGVDRVHLVAVTDELFQQLKDEKARESQKRAGDPNSEAQEATGGGSDPAETQQKEEQFVRLLLKAKGKPDFKLKVKPVSSSTHISFFDFGSD